jgi:hypothetical protein
MARLPRGAAAGVTPGNESLDVYYASSNTTGAPYPTFSHNVRVTDVSHNGNCLLFGGGTAAFHGDYNELDARWSGANHVVHVAWADNRDVSPCDLDPAAGPASNNTAIATRTSTPTGWSSRRRTTTDPEGAGPSPGAL